MGQGIIRIFTNATSKLLRIAIIISFAFAISINSGTFLGYNITETHEASEDIIESRFNLDDVKKLFENAKELSPKTEESFYVISPENERLGFVIHTFPDAEEIRGFMGNLPVLVGFNNDRKIVGIVLQDNQETESYINRMKNAGFFDSWNNMTVEQALEREIDAVTRATITSDAIIEGMHIRLSRLEGVLEDFYRQRVAYFYSDLVGWGLLVILIIAWMRPAKFVKYRTILLFCVVAIYGFWQGRMISLPYIKMITSTGFLSLPISLTASIFLVSVILPLFSNKAFYCTWVCPYGACQELMGKVKKNKCTVSKKSEVLLSRSRLLFLIMFLVLIGKPVDLYSVEPFSAFMIVSAHEWTIGLAAFFLIMSIFVAKPWCRFFCPTGEILDCVKNKPTNQTQSEIINRDIIIFLLIIALISFLIY